MIPSNKPILSFYGDDFTGSGAVADILESNGFKTILFLKIPTKKDLEAFKDCDAIGIASTARAQTSEWMEVHLKEAFILLNSLQAPFFHYKVCSTFDSSPNMGSIGKAIDIADKVFKSNWYPLVVAAPQIGRYQIFGNLFARVNDQIFRLDRHPVMSCHPVTPMNESDILIHLSKQTDRPSELLDLFQIKRTKTLQRKIGQITSIDTFDEESLAEAGRLICQNQEGTLACIGSQAVEYALCAYWRKAGFLKKVEKRNKMKANNQTLVISGSCSKITGKQIQIADSDQFEKILLDISQSSNKPSLLKQVETITDQISKTMAQGKTPLIYSSSGTEHEAYQETDMEIKELIGRCLGLIAMEAKKKIPIHRIVVAGGDTSGYVGEGLELYAVRSLCAGEPGASLFEAHSKMFEHPFEISFKGGQMGGENYFNEMRFGSSF